MPLWFEIAVTVLLAVIAASLVDMCFALERVTRNMANFGIRFEEEVLPRLEAAIRSIPDPPVEEDISPEE